MSNELLALKDALFLMIVLSVLEGMPKSAVIFLPAGAFSTE